MRKIHNELCVTKPNQNINFTILKSVSDSIDFSLAFDWLVCFLFVFPPFFWFFVFLFFFRERVACQAESNEKWTKANIQEYTFCMLLKKRISRLTFCVEKFYTILLDSVFSPPSSSFFILCHAVGAEMPQLFANIIICFLIYPLPQFWIMCISFQLNALVPRFSAAFTKCVNKRVEWAYVCYISIGWTLSHPAFVCYYIFLYSISVVNKCDTKIYFIFALLNSQFPHSQCKNSFHFHRHRHPHFPIGNMATRKIP